ncbi:phenylacetic acid degradation protein PaaD [Pseudoxanthomonas spadix BD-a59]|uniref:Phenylacetic acid degradation protein PaaD n=1 Tax=Pseudoxanthomonas spadix (strain BD-a59) TaxID=1045855 RepID=G7UWH0_PSEUP|nr:hydroxyphenylacetyl-CoA thioesterase PaaI [Pseudoxanthomonas spadix]AER56477.1 phenylacetic acid degradation protein PaaD [Pseudoxanthomonas spadix BD-a59]
MKQNTNQPAATAATAGQSHADALAKRCIAKLRSKDRVSEGLGITIKSGGPGRIALSMAVTEEMLNAYDTCHGGYIFTLADAAFAYASSTRNNAAVGLNCHIDFMRPAKKGDHLYAHSEVTYVGRTTGTTLVKVVDQNNRQIAELHGRYFNVGQAVLDDEASFGDTSA